MSRRTAGLTLVEVLMTCALMGVLGLVMVQIYDVSRTSYATGTGRIVLQQRARTLIERLAPMVVSALPASDVETAIYSPAVGGPPSSEFVFTVPAPDYTPRRPTYRRVRVWHSSGGLVSLDANTPLTPNDDRVIQPDIQGLTFQTLNQNAVRLRVEVYGHTRDATNRERLQSYEVETVIQIPYYSSR